jgi:hypothetical protein
LKRRRVYPGARFLNRAGNIAWVKIETSQLSHAVEVPILEHGKEYVIEIPLCRLIATFDAGRFAFYNNLHWGVKQVKGFAPIPELIKI